MIGANETPLFIEPLEVIQTHRSGAKFLLALVLIEPRLANKSIIETLPLAAGDSIFAFFLVQNIDIISECDRIFRYDFVDEFFDALFLLGGGTCLLVEGLSTGLKRLDIRGVDICQNACC